MLALIDSDILAYEFGSMKELDEEGNKTDTVLPFEVCRKMLDDRVLQIVEATQATDKKLFLTDSSTNFRIEKATILPYKGQRKQEKPEHWEALRQHMIDNYDAMVVRGWEADDEIGVEQYEDFEFHCVLNSHPSDALNTLICTRDKDLDMIPGWHYCWPAGNQTEKLYFQDERDAIRFFYKQLLTGDSVDNILGLHRIGSKNQAVKDLDSLDDELDMFMHVHSMYRSYFGSYADLFMKENGTLLWILRSRNTNEWLERYDNNFDRIRRMQRDGVSEEGQMLEA